MCSCHPQIGSRNKESLGKTNLRTIDEVLDVMVQQNKAQLYLKEKTLFTTKLERAVLTARVHKDNAALPLFTQLAVEAQRQVESWETSLREHRNRRTPGGDSHRTNVPEGEEDIDQDRDGNHVELDNVGKVNSSTDDPEAVAALRHREWQEQHHRILFFTAGFYHDLEMEAEEVEFYDRAEQVRLRILTPSERKFEKLLAVVNRSMHKVKLGGDYIIPASQFKGGIALGPHLEQLELVTNLLNQQLKLLNQWRQDLVDRLTQPLMKDGEEGEQYQYSIDLQHNLESYLHYYGRMLIFRRDLVSGTEEIVAGHVAHVQNLQERETMNKRREDRIRTFKRRQGPEELPKEKEEDLDKRLEREMNELITPDLMSTLRSIRASIKSVTNDTFLPRVEKQMAKVEDLRLKDEQNQQSRLMLELER